MEKMTSEIRTELMDSSLEGRRKERLEETDDKFRSRKEVGKDTRLLL